MPGHQLRSLKSLQTAIRKIHDGVIGDVMTIDAQRHASADIAHDGSSSDWYFELLIEGVTLWNSLFTISIFATG